MLVALASIQKLQLDINGSALLPPTQPSTFRHVTTKASSDGTLTILCQECHEFIALHVLQLRPFGFP